MDAYFEIQDIARRINAGVASYGTERYYVLIKGDSDGYRFLDVKVQSRPTLWSYGPVYGTSNGNYSIPYSAMRVARANKEMLARADDFIGTITLDEPSVGIRYFSVRERIPEKDELAPAGKYTADQLKATAIQYGQIVAAAHARSSSTFATRASNEICSTLGRENFITQTANFAASYLDQVNIDHHYFKVDRKNYC